MMLMTSLLNQMTNRLRAEALRAQNARAWREHETNLARAEALRDAVGVANARSGIRRCQHVADYYSRLCA